MKSLPLIILAAFLTNLFFPASVFPQFPENPDYGDSIIVASIGDARTLVPILASDSASADICSLIFNGLVKYDKDINLVGDLAQSWEILDNGLTIIFHLRQNVKWQDGMPFTAEDVKFTYEKLIDPNIKTPYSGDFERIKSLEILDNYTIKVSYKEPFSPGLSSWGMWIMPKHILGANSTKGVEKIWAEFSRHPVGTGPYKFKTWKTAELIELAANPDYFEGRPYVDKYIYRIIPDQSTIFLELQTQGIDEAGLTPLQYKRQTDNKFFRKYFKKYRYPSFGYTYLGFNLLDEKFKDRRVRQAINYAVNKQEIIDGVLLGLGQPCTGPFPPESWAYNPLVKAVSYSPEKALALLEEAGWLRRNREGWLEKNGKIFEFTIITNQGNEQRQQVAEIIQRRLAQVGIKVKIKIIEWSAFLSEFINKKKFEAVLLGWFLSRDPDCFDIWHSSKIKEGEFNFVSYQNAEVDKLLEEGRREFDQGKRKKIYNQIHQILYADQPCIFLYVPDALPIVHSRFKGIEPAPIGIGYNFIKWYVPKSRQKYTR